MLDVHHYSSKLQRLVFLALATLAVAGCSGSSIDNMIQPAAAKPPSMTQPVALKTKKAIKQKSQKFARNKQAVQPKSQWCTYLSEDAAANATILRAPTISGDINDDGRKSATLGFDVMNIARAQLIESNAQAKCRRYLANSALNRMVITAPNNLTRSGYAAKARVISNRSPKLRAIKSLVRRELGIGNLDRSQATSLLLAADQVLADGAKASSEAAKRQGLVAFDMKNVAALAAQLLKAEKEMADINSDIRSADAVSVNLEGGWREGFVQNGVRVQKNAMFGGVKVSLKLGAFNPLRYSHEAAANRARIGAHRSEPGSVFWKINELVLAHQRGRAGLVSAHRQLVGARANAVRLKQNLPAGDPAFLAQRYKTEIAIIKLSAEIAASKASLDQLDSNLSKLRQLRM